MSSEYYEFERRVCKMRSKITNDSIKLKFYLYVLDYILLSQRLTLRQVRRLIKTMRGIENVQYKLIGRATSKV